ncbi:MAG: hypothetical protein ABL998_01095, partial [Planctomycetota bacterium]
MMEPSPLPPGSTRPAQSPRRWLWLDATALLVFAACVFAGTSLTDELFLATGAALFLPILWLVLVGLVVVL